MLTLWQDLRYGLRMLLKHPGFTLVAVLTLALGIGANTAIFSVVNTVLLRPLALKEPEQLVKLYETLPQGGTGSVSAPNLKDWREQNDVLAGISAYQFASFNLQGKEQPERVLGATVAANFFEVLGVRPKLGRSFLEGEDQPTSDNRVVVLSDRLWQRNFGADPSVVGKRVLIGGESFTVLGVMPQSFKFPAQAVDVWVPLVIDSEKLNGRGVHAFQVIGRLKAGVTVAQAQEQMSVIGRRLEAQYPQQQERRNILVVPLQQEAVQYVRPALLMLLGAVGFILLIACTNVANLLLARAAARRKEIAIRTALGAGRGRLIRQFLTESVLLSVLGGALGLLFAKWGVDALVKLLAASLPRSSEIGLDWRVLGFTLVLSLLTGIVFGLAPALQISKTDVQESLKEGATVGSTPRGNWLRSLLVIAEVAAALVLLIGAGLLIKSFNRLQQVESGLRPERVLTMKISLPAGRYDSTEAASIFYQQVLSRINTLPGVETAGVVNMLPLKEAGYNGGISVEGREPFPAGQEPLTEYRAASPDYFRALGIPLIAGRFFNAQDALHSAPVVIVNQALVREALGNQDPIGKRIHSGISSDWMTIVGVTGDVKQWTLTQATRPEIFVPITQAQASNLTQTMSLVVRATTDPQTLVPLIRREVMSVDPSQPVYDVQMMEEVIGKSVSSQRVNMLLLSLFAALAMLLATVGLYSVMSYLVTQHTREIGIRMALGAQPLDIMRLVIGQGLLLTLMGVGLGILLAAGLMRLISSLLYGVTATDPLTFVLVSLLLLGVALLACYIPARRAMRVDPMEALRYE